jgi:ABC-type phosphate transport system substrate-binding protein
MGRLAKNPQVSNVIAEAVTLPIGSTATRPVSPINGTFRFNTSTNKLEIYNGSQWRTVGSEGTVAITKDTFTGDGSTSVFGAMSFSKANGTEKTVQVFVGNVHQNPGVAYTFDGGTDITFTSPPPNTHSIVILHGFDSTVAE